MKNLLKAICLCSIVAGGAAYGITYKVSNDSNVGNGGFFLSRSTTPGVVPSGVLVYSTCAADKTDLVLSESFSPNNSYNVAYTPNCEGITPGEFIPSTAPNIVNLYTVSYQYAPGNITGVLDVEAAYISKNITFNPTLQILCDDHIDLFTKYTAGYLGQIFPEDAGVCNIHIASSN